MMDMLFVILLTLLFAFSAMMLIALGADVYQKNVDDARKNYEQRTSCAYITQKVRQCDAGGEITLGDLDGIPALKLTQQIGERSYTTWLYCHDHELREIFAESSVTLTPESGMAIMALEDLQIEQPSGDLFRLSLTEANGSHQNLVLAVHSAAADGEVAR